MVAREQVSLGFAVVAALALMPTTASAQLTNGDPISSSDYRIDISRTAFLGGTRAIGLGGTGASIAYGIDGGLLNPAAVANRPPDWPTWFDYWLALGLTFPLSSGDFYNSGGQLADLAQIDQDKVLFASPGIYLQFGHLGVGLAFEFQNAELDIGTTGAQIDVNFVVAHLQVGYGLLDGQLLVGGGLRVFYQDFSVRDPNDDSPTVTSTGYSAELGVVYQPHHKRWRVGASFFPRLRTDLSSEQGDVVVGGFYLPRGSTEPHRGRVGFSMQFGPRPTNPPWVYWKNFACEEVQLANNRTNKSARKRAKKEIEYAARRVLRERYRRGWPRRYMLLTADLEFFGRVNDGVGVESFLAQRVQRSGQKIGVTPHVGIEGEPWPHRMKLRGGAYLENSRFDRAPRIHGTLGLDLRVLDWNVFGLWPDDYQWQIALAADIAKDYRSISFSLGGWY